MTSELKSEYDTCEMIAYVIQRMSEFRGAVHFLSLVCYSPHLVVVRG